MSEPTYITPVQKVVELQAALAAANADAEALAGAIRSQETWNEECVAALAAHDERVKDEAPVMPNISERDVKHRGEAK